MNLDMGDGRMLQMPDEMSDEAARQLKRLILTCEERAATAEAQVRALQDEMAVLRRQLASVAALQADERATVAALKEMHGMMERCMRDMVRAAAADRVLTNDEHDRPISRIVR